MPPLQLSYPEEERAATVGTPKTRACGAASEPRSDPVFCHCPALPHPPVANLFSCAPACSQPGSCHQPSASTAVHMSRVRGAGRVGATGDHMERHSPCSCLWAQINHWLATSHLPIASPSSCVPSCPQPNSHHQPPMKHTCLRKKCAGTDVCSQPLQLSVCTPLALTSTTACPGPQLLDLEVPLRSPIVLASTAYPPHTLFCAHQGPHSCQCCGPNWPKLKRHHASQMQCHHKPPYLATWTTRPKSQHDTVCLYSQVKCFCY